MMTSGEHNAETLAYCATYIALLVTVVVRLYRSVTVGWSLAVKSNYGISYIPPKSSVQLADFNGITFRHQEELILLVQEAPENYRLEKRMVNGHLDGFKCVVDGSNVRVELEAVGNGTCTVLLNPPVDGIDTLIFPIDSGLTTRLKSVSQAATKSAAYTADTANLVFTLPRSHSGRMTMFMVVIESQGHLELTCIHGHSQRGGPMQIASSQQFLCAQDGQEAIHVLPTYSQNVSECMVCYDGKSNIVVLPCRHCSVCDRCVSQLREPRCIVCRQQFTQYLVLPRGPLEATQTGIV